MGYLTRRRFLVSAGVASAATLAFTGYATAYETGSALALTPYTPRPRGWPEDLELRIAVIADIHACYPWMSEERIRDIVDLANAQKPDLTVLLGDYVCTHPFVSGYVPPGAWAEQLARLEAPLGVYSILGNHD
jgi:predicted MPP superfamily phosphohydrolase